MPPIEEADFVHDVVVWERTGTTRDNEVVVADPVQLLRRARWTWQRRVTTDPQGTPVELVARVAVPLDLPERSLFFQGTLRDWTESGANEVYQSVGVARADDVTGRSRRREYDLARFRGRLPANAVPPGRRQS